MHCLIFSEISYTLNIMAKKKIIKKKKSVAKNPVGNPTKFDKSLIPVIKKLFLAGKTNIEVAWMLDICEKTLYTWFNKNEELLQAVRESKLCAVKQVENSLFQNANGYIGKETKVFCTKDGSIKTKTVLKHYKPDVSAQQYYLNNRNSDNWKTKVEHGIDPESAKEFTLNYKPGDSKKKK